jgi:hypothetical protein
MRKRLQKEIRRLDRKAKAIETRSERSFFTWLARRLRKQGAGVIR